MQLQHAEASQAAKAAHDLLVFEESLALAKRPEGSAETAIEVRRLQVL